MSKRLLLKSVLFVSTVAPVMACYATDNNTTTQNPGIFTQEIKKTMPPSETSMGQKDSTQNKDTAVEKNIRTNASSKADESEEMD